MKTKKIILTLALAALLLGINACKRPYDTVFSTYKDGSPKLVFTVIDRGDGKVDRVGEKMYYENGNMMYEKHYDGDRPCGNWCFFYENGNPHAEGNFDTDDSLGSGWKIYAPQGGDFVSDGYDSMRVVELTADHRPLSVSYFKGDNETLYRFNENYSINAFGNIKDGKKEGRWEFFYANGQKMLEAQYIGNVENGLYNSYRENGIPYFRGFYINGKRANIWEFYDADGNLAGTQDFDKH